MQAGAQTLWQKARVSKLEKRLSAQRVLCESLRTESAFRSIAENVFIDMQKKLFKLRGENVHEAGGFRRKIRTQAVAGSESSL